MRTPICPPLAALAVALAAACSSVNTGGLNPPEDGAVDTGTPPTDTGTPPMDTGTPPVDAGTPPTDTGTPPVDAGTPPVDVGSPPVDAGTPPVDVGPPPTDRGSPVDAGTPPVDVGTPPVDAGTPPAGVAVTTFQFDRGRTGANRSETRLTVAAVRAGFARVTAFAPSLDGDVYAQPLYLPGLTVRGARHDVLFVATQNNSVYALDAASGAELWRTGLGTPVPRTAQSCGNITTIGVVSTGVIDRATNTLYAVAFTNDGALQFKLNALDVTTGAQRPGYPVNLSPPTTGGSSFDPRTTGQRGALQLVDGRVYVPFGGLYGDCGIYHGWVVGIDAANPAQQVAFATPGRGSGIWAVGGPAMDEGGRLYVATGNSTPLGGSTPGSFGERLIRLGGGAAGPTPSTDAASYFEASDARMLDLQDLDIGSVSPVVLPAVAGAPRLLWQGGKAGVSYLINRENLGGTGGQLFQSRYFSGGNFGAAAAWSNGADTYVFAPGRGTRANGCTGSGGVMALRVSGAGYTTAWCTATVSNPSPPAVSSNGNSGAILWLAGSATSGAGSLRAVDVSNGMEIFSDAPPSVRQWTPVVVADGRVYVTGSRTVFLYTTR
jgi:outer membrane protein assembly factor BamB